MRVKGKKKKISFSIKEYWKRSLGPGTNKGLRHKRCDDGSDDVVSTSFESSLFPPFRLLKHNKYERTEAAFTKEVDVGKDKDMTTQNTRVLVPFG